MHFADSAVHSFSSEICWYSGFCFLISFRKVFWRFSFYDISCNIFDLLAFMRWASYMNSWWTIITFLQSFRGTAILWIFLILLLFFWSLCQLLNNIHIKYRLHLTFEIIWYFWFYDYPFLYSVWRFLKDFGFCFDSSASEIFLKSLSPFSFSGIFFEKISFGKKG